MRRILPDLSIILMSFQQDPSGLILRKINTMKKKWIILLDNGHGKETPGKRTSFKEFIDKIVEWIYTRRLTRAIRDRLLDMDIDCRLLVPEDQDIPLKIRAERANSIAAIHGASNCLLISVHLNAARNENQAKGWEIHTSPGTTASDRYANEFWKEAKLQLGDKTRMRGDYTDGDKDWDSHFYILKKTICPAVLTENLFMNHEDDCHFLASDEGFNTIVNIHVNAIHNIVNS